MTRNELQQIERILRVLVVDHGASQDAKDEAAKLNGWGAPARELVRTAQQCLARGEEIPGRMAEDLRRSAEEARAQRVVLAVAHGFDAP